MRIDQAREYTIIVNGGSGCFFQTADPDFTYILTAKHNIEDAGNQVNELTHFRLRNGIWDLIDIQFDLEEGINYYPHPNQDIAILKIEKLEGYDAIFKIDDLDLDRLGYFLLGYPDTRRKASPNDKREWYREDPNVEILGTTNQRRGAQIPGNPDREEVVGHSGGAVVRIENERLLLGGIENSMAQAVNEQMGRIEFTPIEAFDEIINLFPDRLFSLLPPYLLSFSFLQEKTFDLKAGWDSDDIEFTKNYLKDKCTEVIESDLTPIVIKNLFNDRLLINSKNAQELECKTIWILWLEFLTIMNIFKGKIHSIDDISSIFNEYRLFFSDTKNDWSDELENLAYSDYYDLPNESMVIVGVQKSPELGAYEIKPDRIPLIGQARQRKDRSRLRIDKGFNWPYDHFRFVHIDYFKNGAIVDKRKEYAHIVDDEELLEKLKEVYEELFKS